MKSSIDFVNIEVPCGSWMIKHFTNIIIGNYDRATFLNYSPFVNDGIQWCKLRTD
jgi:hypothetical protein